MATLPKKAFNILLKDGPISLGKKSGEFLQNRFKKPRRRLRIKKNVWDMKRQFDAVADPYKILSINSENITRYIQNPSWDNPWNVWGQVKGGEWDLENTVQIEEYTHYQAFNKHFIHGVSWECVADYRMQRKKQKNNLPYRGYETWDEVQQHYKRKYMNGQYDKLYQDIQQNGFQTQPIPKSDPSACNYYAPHMTIGRDGEFIFWGDGHHRTAIAKLLELDNIPVYVYLRHKQWQNLRDDIEENGLPEHREDLRNHPDLQDVLN